MSNLDTMLEANGLQRPEAETLLDSFNVGTRKSKLALVQTDLVVQALETARPDYTFHIKSRDTAAGDIDKVTPFKDMSVKNLWTHELETLMMEGSLDLLVHSLKDVPTQLPPPCQIGAVLAREDPRDVLVLKAGRQPCRMVDLPSGAVIGTSSIRRTAQIALKYPHLVVKDIRGNIHTRLGKLDAEDGAFDAIVIAAAGLLRLDLGDRITQYLDSGNGGMLYAVGQGAIGIENRSDDVKVTDLLSSVNHSETYLACMCERALLRKLEGGCSAPLGVESKWRQNESGSSILHLKAMVVSVNGKYSAEVDLHSVVHTVPQAEAFGVTAADALCHRGADQILADIKAKKPTEAADLTET